MAKALEKVAPALNDRETALQKVGEYFGEPDLFITDEDLKDLILVSNPSIVDASDLNAILPQIHRRLAMLSKLDVSRTLCD